MIMLLGSIAVTPLGGYVAETFGWRAVFLAKVPLLVAIAATGHRTIPACDPDHPHAAGRRLPAPDRSLLLDALLVGTAVAAGLLAVDRFEHSRAVAVGLVAIALALAGWWSRLPASRPVIALVRIRTLGLPALALLLVASISGLMAFTLPYFIDEVLGRGPDTLGVAIVFFVAAGAVTSPVAGALADQRGPLPIAAGGAALTTAAVLAMLTLGPDAGMADLGWRLAALGAAMAVFNAPAMAAILHATPDGREGAAGGITSLARTLGTTVGPAVAAATWSLAGGGVPGLRAGVLALGGLAGGPASSPCSPPAATLLVGCETVIAGSDVGRERERFPAGP